MKKLVIIIFLLSIYLCPPAVWAKEALFCTFPTTSSSYQIYPPSIVVETNKDLSFTLSDMDPNGSAKLTGNAGSVKVAHFYQGHNQIFVQLAGEGSSTLTTVFFKSPNSDGRFPAVHSRHVVIYDKPSISQNFGSCKQINIPE